jgi:hypothetical protein
MERLYMERPYRSQEKLLFYLNQQSTKTTIYRYLLLVTRYSLLFTRYSSNLWLIGKSTVILEFELFGYILTR